MSGEREARIGLLGRGTVGGAFEQLIEERADELAAASGKRPRISGVLTTREGDFESILADSDIVVELMGGTDPARDYVLRALSSGRDVVTANKQLVAQHGEELFEAARAAGVQLRFEAAVAGVVPVVRVIQQALAASEITRVMGIVNGTTNFILSEMAATGASYADVLARAQELGYAESDPTDDVGGADAAAKMAILGRLAFGVPIRLADVAYEGITEIRPDDIAYAAEFGLSLKLLGIAELHADELSVRVFPCFLPGEHALAPIGGPFNAVTVEGPAIDSVTLSGPGAGGPQTATAVIGDLVSLLSGTARVHETHRDLRLVHDLRSSFYVHLEVADRPGVLARVADALGTEEVSVRSVVQRGHGNDARLVMVMHPCPESRFYAALAALRELDFLRAEPRAIRVAGDELA